MLEEKRVNKKLKKIREIRNIFKEAEQKQMPENRLKTTVSDSFSIFELFLEC